MAIFQKWLFWGLASISIFSNRALADYLIPYELRIHSASGYTQHTLIVSLADHYSRYFGASDDLYQYLATNHYEGIHPYLVSAFEWYLKFVAESEGIYGDAASTISDNRRKYEPIDDGFSSAVVVTEFQRPEAILGMLRVSAPDGSGRVPVIRHYWDMGLNQRNFPSLTPTSFGRFKEILFQLDPHGNGISLAPPFRSRSVQWVGGGRVELKNLGIPTRLFGRIFPYLYLTGRLHKMYSYDGSPIPAKIKKWPGGKLITDVERNNMGLRATEICLEATGDDLQGMYEKLLDVKTWETLQNEHTGWQEMHFMHAKMAKADAKVESTVGKWISRNPKVWLRYDHKLAELLHSCQGSVAMMGL